jgi:hypothetical protein
MSARRLDYPIQSQHIKCIFPIERKQEDRRNHHLPSPLSSELPSRHYPEPSADAHKHVSIAFILTYEIGIRLRNTFICHLRYLISAMLISDEANAQRLASSPASSDPDYDPPQGVLRAM